MQTIAVVRDHQQLVAAFKDWVAELSVARETGNNHVVAPVPIKAVGRTNLGWILSALGLKIIVAVDHEALERIRHRLTPRSADDVRRIQTRQRNAQTSAQRAMAQIPKP